VLILEIARPPRQIANKFARRIHGFGQAGGGRGTGLEPSPRRPAWGKVSQRTPSLQPACQAWPSRLMPGKDDRELYRAKAPAAVNFRRGLCSDGIFAFVALLGACPPQMRFLSEEPAPTWLENAV